MDKEKLIQKYLASELSSEESLRFEELISQDTAFSEEVDLRSIFYAERSLLLKKELNKALARSDQKYAIPFPVLPDQKKQASTRIKQNDSWYYTKRIAAILLLTFMLMGSYQYFSGEKADSGSSEGNIVNTDSSEPTVKHLSESTTSKGSVNKTPSKLHNQDEGQEFAESDPQSTQQKPKEPIKNSNIPPKNSLAHSYSMAEPSSKNGQFDPAYPSEDIVAASQIIEDSNKDTVSKEFAEADQKAATLSSNKTPYENSPGNENATESKPQEVTATKNELGLAFENDVSAPDNSRIPKSSKSDPASLEDFTAAYIDPADTSKTTDEATKSTNNQANEKSVASNKDPQPVLEEGDAWVEGMVMDMNNEPVPFLNVTTRTPDGAVVGGVTDLDGRYKIKIKEGDYELNYSYVGLENYSHILSLKSGDKRQVDVSMRAEESMLNSVVVTASRFKERLGKTACSMDVIRPTLIENSQSISIDQALAKVPGVQIVDGQTTIRGGTGFSYGVGSRTAFLVDDLSILTGDNGVVNFDFVPIDNIEQIEVIKGASSVLYGSAALNGIVNVRTAKPGIKPKTSIAVYRGLYDNPSGGNDTIINVRAARIDTITGARNWWKNELGEIPFETGIYANDSRKISKLDLVSSFHWHKSKSFRETEKSDWWRIHSNAQYRISNKMNAGLRLNFQKKKSTTFILWAGLGPEQWQSSDAIENPQNDITRFTIDPFFNYQSSNGWKHKFLSRIQMGNNSNQTKQSFNSIKYHYEYHIAKKFPALKLTSTAGIVSSQTFAEGSLYKGDEADEEAIVQRSTSNQALFLQFDKQFGERLNTNIGARWERNSMTGSQSEAKPIFRAGANYELAKNSSFLRASFGQGYRFPTIAEKYVLTDLGFLTVSGDPDLQSETGFSTEIGLKQKLPFSSWNAYADFSLFYNRYDEMIDFSFGGPNGNEAAFIALNTGATETRGAEISVTGKGQLFGQNTDLTAGYTYVDPRFVDWDSTQMVRSSSDQNVLKYRFRHNAKMDLQSYFSKFSVGLSAEYLSTMEAIDAAFLDFIPGIEKYQEMNQNGEFTMNARIEFTAFKTGSISVRMKNIFNNSYSVRPGLMEGPRFLQVRLSYQF